MSRPLRLRLAGGLYHVTSRGDRREDIYRGDADASGVAYDPCPNLRTLQLADSRVVSNEQPRGPRVRLG